MCIVQLGGMSSRCWVSTWCMHLKKISKKIWKKKFEKKNSKNSKKNSIFFFLRTSLANQGTCTPCCSLLGTSRAIWMLFVCVTYEIVQSCSSECRVFVLFCFMLWLFFKILFSTVHARGACVCFHVHIFMPSIHKTNVQRKNNKKEAEIQNVRSPS